jgi:hypothetical protein
MIVDFESRLPPDKTVRSRLLIPSRILFFRDARLCPSKRMGPAGARRVHSCESLFRLSSFHICASFSHARPRAAGYRQGCLQRLPVADPYHITGHLRGIDFQQLPDSSTYPPHSSADPASCTLFHVPSLLLPYLLHGPTHYRVVVFSRSLSPPSDGEAAADSLTMQRPSKLCIFQANTSLFWREKLFIF